MPSCGADDTAIQHNVAISSDHIISSTSSRRWFIVEAPVFHFEDITDHDHVYWYWDVGISRKHGILNNTHHFIIFQTFLDARGREYILGGESSKVFVEWSNRDEDRMIRLRMHRFPRRIESPLELRRVRLIVIERRLFEDIKEEKSAMNPTQRAGAVLLEYRNHKTFGDLYDSWIGCDHLGRPTFNRFVKKFVHLVLYHEFHSAIPLLEVALFEMFTSRRNLPLDASVSSSPESLFARHLCSPGHEGNVGVDISEKLLLNALRMMDHRHIIPLLMKHKCTMEMFLSSSKFEAYHEIMLKWLRDLVANNRFIHDWEAIDLEKLNYWIRPGFDVEKCAEERREATKTVFFVSSVMKDLVFTHGNEGNIEDIEDKDIGSHDFKSLSSTSGIPLPYNTSKQEVLKIVEDWVELPVGVV